MKRLLPLLVIVSLFAVTTQGQTTKKAGKIARIWVQNTGPSSIAVFCERFEESLAPSSVNYFCWDACYAPPVSLSIGTLPINPGDTNKFFYADYDPGTGTGNSVLTYCFYVDGIPADSACFSLTYSENSPADSVYGTIAINSFVGIEFIKATNRNEILDIHPNPAKELVALNYSLASGSEVGVLLVRNVLGSEVYKAELVGAAGQVIIPVEKFNNGMYFCTMVVDNKVYETKRLVVNH